MAADTLLYPGEKLVLPTTKITEASIRHRLGIDKPMGVQYYEFLWETMRLQFSHRSRLRRIRSTSSCARCRVRCT